MPAQNTNSASSIESTDYSVFAMIAATISVAALTFYYRHNSTLLYGDAVAHINKARLVFDSRTPGLFQLGTVWLPLPHLIDIPFLINGRLWQTGIGGSIPSMLAYLAGALGIFRLVRSRASRLCAWTAALIYTLNPNLIYMQSTAMTEPLYLALFIWAVVHFSDFVRDAARDPGRARSSLEKCALLVGGAMLVRYDGWFLAGVIGVVAVIQVWRTHAIAPRLWRGVFEYALLTSAVAALWLAYNYNAYGNPLEFATGPYSARAIEARSLTPTWTSYPGENSARTAALYFLKVSRLNLAEGKSEYIFFSLAFISFLCVCYFGRKFLPWILLWSPAIFYTASIAWGSVPVYFPEWWPFTYYNVRYGLQMLPAAAVFAALMIEFAGKIFPQRRPLAVALLLAIAAWSYGSVWAHIPITLREAQVNGTARLHFEVLLATELRKLPASATFLMDGSGYPGALQAASIPFRRVLRESNPPQWEIALTQPARAADYIIAIDHDAVASSVRLFPQDLQPVVAVSGAGGLRATIYRSSRCYQC